MNKVDVSVLKYLGKVANGIISLITITFKEEDNFTFDATFFYTDTQMLVTIPEDVEQLIGGIKDHPLYMNILEACIKKVVPYNELIDNIDPLDVRPYLKAIYPNEEF
jgi:hypothetical protein